MIHRTHLTYHLPGGVEVEVGEVTCVPMKGDYFHRDEAWYIISRMVWTPDPEMPVTWVIAILRSASPLRKMRHDAAH